MATVPPTKNLWCPLQTLKGTPGIWIRHLRPSSCHPIDSAPPPIVLSPNPIVLQRGTVTAVDNSVANLLSAGFDDDPRRRTHHDILRPLPTSSPDTPNPPVNPDNLNDTQSSRIDLDALERKIRRIGEKIDRLLSVTDGVDADDDAPHRVDLDALERKILRSLHEDFLHLNPCNNPALPTTALPTMPLNANALPPLSTVPDRLDLLEAKIRRSLHEDFRHLDDDPCAPDDDPSYPASVSTLPPAIHTTRFPFGMAMHLLLAQQVHEDRSLPAPSPFIPASSMPYCVFPLAPHLPTSLTLPCHSDRYPHNTMTHQSASLLPQYRPRPPAKPNPLAYHPIPYDCSYPMSPPALCSSYLPQSPASPKDDHRPP